MDKTKTKEKQGKRTQVCSCRNSCQKGTGPKRAGCPCKDEGLYCSDQCKCGTNVIVCRNNQHDCQTKGAGVESNKLRKNRFGVVSPKTDLVSQVSNRKVIDESDGNISDEESSSKQGPSTKMTSVENNASVIPNLPLKGQGKDRTQKTLPQSLLGPVHRINNGYALVIHNRYFYNLRPRKGSEKDLDAIKIFCKEADLTIDIQDGLKVNDIRTHCRKLNNNKNRKFQNYDGFLCFILSHGNKSGICGVYDDTISVKEIVSYFKENDDLLGKPKLFFIQACRSKNGEVEDDSCESDQKKRLCPPDSSDVLVAHSTIKGELSWRDIRTGSWFIQTLMKQFTAHAQNSHLMDIMTVVNEDIAGSELDGKRQMPIQVSTLTKFVYFKMATAPEGEEC